MANLLNRWLPSRRWRVTATARSVNDVPERLRRRTAVLIGTADRPKWLVFACPCRVRHRVVLNLVPANYPAWTVHSHRPLTVTPSIDEHGPDRRCHYVINAGRIRWVPSPRRGAGTR